MCNSDALCNEKTDIGQVCQEVRRLRVFAWAKAFLTEFVVNSTCVAFEKPKCGFGVFHMQWRQAEPWSEQERKVEHFFGSIGCHMWPTHHLNRAFGIACHATHLSMTNINGKNMARVPNAVVVVVETKAWFT